MNLVSETQSYKIYNKTLNSKLWVNDNLKPEVLKKLKLMSTYFITQLSIELNIDIDLKDIIIAGSSAGYNWNDYSDIDVHYIIDFNNSVKNNQDIELVKKIANNFKSNWNSKHYIEIYSHPVEVYIEDISEPVKSSSVYSLLKNDWIKKPKKEIIKVDKTKIKSDYSTIISEINKNIKLNNIENLKKILVNLYRKRENSLQTEGEYSEFNIIFKLLRLNGYIKMLQNSIIKIKDSEFTLK